MAEKKFTKGSEEWLFFQDFYRLCQSIWIVENSDEYWDDVFQKTNELYKKYPDDFCKGQVLALIDYLDKKAIKLKSGFEEEN